MSKKPKKSKSKRAPIETRGMVNLVKNPVWAAFSKKPVDDRTQITVGLASRQALYALQHGDAKLNDFTELNVTVHAALILAERGYGADLMEDFQAAHRVMQACRSRAHHGQPWRLSADESVAIALVIDLHEQQFKLSGKAELATAIVDGFTRIDATGSTRIAIAACQDPQ